MSTDQPEAPALPGVTRWRPRRIELEARRFDPGADYDEACEVITWCGASPSGDGCTIATPDGYAHVNPGDWIVRYAGGWFRAWEPAAFAATYVPAETPDAESPAPVPAGPGEASRGALKRVQALAVSWATLTAAEERHELDAEVSARLGRHLLDVIHGGAGDAAYRVNLVARVAESWVTPGGPGVFYPAAGQAVLDAIRGASTETEADWQARAEAAEAKLAAWSAHRNAACAALRIAETASRYGNAPVTADRYRAAREALEGGEGDGRT